MKILGEGGSEGSQRGVEIMAKSKKKISYFTITPSDENIQNSLNIFYVLKKQSSLSVADVAKSSGISNERIAEYINSGVKKDLLRISGDTNRGVINFNNGYDGFLGIGFNNESCFLTIMSLGGDIIDKKKISITPLSQIKGKSRDIKGIIEAIKNSAKLNKLSFSSVGLAVPRLIKKKNLKAEDILAEGVSRIFDCETFIADEATAAGYSERSFGSQTKGEDVLYIHSDVGIGVVVKKEMIFGIDGQELNADMCGSNADGRGYLQPWEQFSVVSTARGLVDKGMGTSIVEAVGGNINKINLEVVLDAAGKGDELAIDLVRRAGLSLGIRVSYLVNMFNMEVVILGGGTERKEGDFIKFVNEGAKRFLLKNMADKVKIIPGVLGREASSIGAGLLCCRELFMEV